MMTYIDHHETFLPPHLMIHITSTLLHPISSLAPNLSSHFTPCLFHQPWTIPQSFIHTLGAYPSHK